MAKCPNCGEKVSRTEDWACPLCAYPLMSGSFRLIPKTYTQLKEEERAARLALLPEVPVSREEPEPEPEIEPEPPAGLEAEPEAGPEPVVARDDEEMIDPDSEVALEAEIEPERKPKRRTRAKSRARTTAKTEKPKRATRRKPAARAAATPEPEVSPDDEVMIEPDTEPAQAELELTAEEMLAAYETDSGEADARFSGKVIRLTGVVNRVEVKEMMNIQYITLGSPEKERMLSVRCSFSQEYAAELSQLMVGQTVSLIGQYDGSVIDISLRDCVFA